MIKINNPSLSISDLKKSQGQSSLRSNPRQVDKLFKKCLANVSSPEIIRVVGPTTRIILDRKKLHAHKLEIFRLVDELSTLFRTREGGSLDNLQVDYTNRPWTISPKTAEKLLLLGLPFHKFQFIDGMVKDINEFPKNAKLRIREIE